MRSLIQNGIVDSYGPLVDIPGSYVAQFEHVSIVHDSKTAGLADAFFYIDRSPPAQLQGGDLSRRRLLRE